MAATGLALFDLDHTLIGFDSGMAWCEVHERTGRLPPGSHARYLACCQAYVHGHATLHDLHDLLVAPLSGLSRDTLQAWQVDFADAMAARVSPWARQIVASHRHAGHLCVLVTATSKLVASGFSALFGTDALLATESCNVSGDAGPSAVSVLGAPCWGAHKLDRVQDWLAQRSLGQLSDHASWFYSDSHSDLPLLQAVTHPVVVAPDPRLLAHARTHGWPIVQRGAPAHERKNRSVSARRPCQHADRSAT